MSNVKRISEEDVRELNRMGKSDNKIAKQLGVTQRGVSIVRYRLNLRANYPNFRGEKVEPKHGLELIKAYLNLERVKSSRKAYSKKNNKTDKRKAYRRAWKKKKFEKIRGLT